MLYGPPENIYQVKVMSYVHIWQVSPMCSTPWHKQMSGDSDIGKGMDLPILHFDQLYIRH